jgi:MATE family multidrug resistance protein
MKSKSLMNREIFRLAIPNIISNISVPLLSSVDTALMGRLSDAHIGAVGIGSMIFNFIYWNFGFLRMGTTGLTAQSFGRRDSPEIMNNLARALMIALGIAIAILVMKTPFRIASVHLMHVSENSVPLVTTYFNIRIWAAPATLSLYAVMGWFFGMQNAVYPLILTILINVINIILSYVFVYHLQMDVRGVAWGTVIAQYAGLLGAVLLFHLKYAIYIPELKSHLLWKWEAYRAFLRVNGDIFLRTFFLTFAFGFFYSQSSRLGDQVLAVNVILLQYVNWMSYGIDGFAFAAESLVGKYFGARDYESLKASIKLNFKWSLGMAIGIALIYLAAAEPLLGVFTNQHEIIEAARPYLWWMASFPIIAFGAYIWDGIYIGMTASRAMRNSMAVSLVIFLIAHYSLSPFFQNHGLWGALFIFLIVRGIIQFLLYRKYGFNLQ